MTSGSPRQAGYADRIYPHWVDVRVSTLGLELLPLLGRHSARRAMELAGSPDAAGWVRTRLPLETERHAEVALLRLGPELVVLGPPPLRARMTELAVALAARYAQVPDVAPSRDDEDAPATGSADG